MSIDEKLKAAEDARQRGDYNHAESVLREVLEAQTTDSERARALHVLGLLETNRSNYLLALEQLEKALGISVSVGDRSGEARIGNSIGIVHYHLSDYPRALEYYSRALVMYTEAGDKAGIASVTANFGNVFNNLSDYPKALEYLSRAFAMHQELGAKLNMANVTLNIGNVHQRLSDHSNALEHYNRALVMYEELCDKSGAATVTGNTGNVYASFADYPKALEYYSKALSMYEELGSRKGIAIVTGGIGIVHAKLSDYPKAVESMSRALSMHEELGDKRGVVSMTANLGEAYVLLGDHASALKYFEQALNLAQVIGDRRQCAYSLAGIGSVYAALKQHDKGREYLQQALVLSRSEIGTNEGVADILIELGKLQLEEQNAVEAAKLLEDAFILAHELGDKAKEYQAHEELARAYELMGNIDQAYHHYKLFHSLNKEVQSEEARKKVEQIEQQRRAAEMERRLAAEQAVRDQQLAIERAAAEATTSLLHKVLPSQVADRLLKGERVADYFQHISILFVDIVGFTPIAARMPAKTVLAFLNYVFGEFDKVMEKHDCQKIKTIGDGYMAVCGAPIACDDHAERLASAARELMSGIELPDAIRKSLPKDSVFHLRMGLHTGAAFAGIVGEKGFVYDVYSDAVNLAARMESSGEAGKIHCSEEFAYHLQNRDESFVFEERGEIEVKGKGMMRTYYLVVV